MMLLVTPLTGSNYVGNTACAPCHESEFRRQSQSHHSHALQPIAGSILERTFLTDGSSPDGRVQYESSGKGIAAQEVSGPKVLLQWAFGAGVQGSTAVGLFGDQYIEHRFSYYSRIHNLATTFGHSPKAVTPIAELGVLQDSRTITHCFSCHATGVIAKPPGPHIDQLLLGVQCERCHGPGSTHIEVARKKASIGTIQHEIVNPGRFAAQAQIEICGQCHRLPGPDTGDAPELEDPVTVRFAPIGLLTSRCFRESKKLSCLTCHDPHEDAKARTDSGYTEKCLSCHASDPRPVKLCRRKTQENCVPCHMPRTALSAYLSFTDHRIRVADRQTIK
jgi:hypothetical protein